MGNNIDCRCDSLGPIECHLEDLMESLSMLKNQHVPHVRLSAGNGDRRRADRRFMAAITVMDHRGIEVVLEASNTTMADAIIDLHLAFVQWRDEE